MLDLFESLFDSSGFPPRWRCGTWTLTQGWLHIASDLGVWLAYTSIPIVLAFFVIRKKHLPFRGLFILFTAFILACGLTHLMEAIIFWWPAYRLAGVLKFLTALVSWSTVVALIQTTPSLLAMRTPEELEREVSARRAAEESLTLANAGLEQRVVERTQALSRANAELAAERERFRTTLSSIGDAVIATDSVGRITFLNPVAQAQTKWAASVAHGLPLDTVFRTIDETTRHPLESPAERALYKGLVVEMANHTLLLDRDGGELPIGPRDRQAEPGPHQRVERSRRRDHVHDLVTRRRRRDVLVGREAALQAPPGDRDGAARRGRAGRPQDRVPLA
jgi:PAS domain-containing protein